MAYLPGRMFYDMVSLRLSQFVPPFWHLRIVTRTERQHTIEIQTLFVTILLDCFRGEGQDAKNAKRANHVDRAFNEVSVANGEKQTARKRQYLIPRDVSVRLEMSYTDGPSCCASVTSGRL